jgi:hypothetical protein
MSFSVGAIAALAACAGGPGGLTGAASGPAADAPAYRVGDRWVYHGDDGFRVKTEWEETHEVTAIGPEGLTARVTPKGRPLDFPRTELWSAPGQVKVGALCGDGLRRRFDLPLELEDFPLATGNAWPPSVAHYNEATQQTTRSITGCASGAGSCAGGGFDAISMQVVMRLDDETFWRYATTCNTSCGTCRARASSAGAWANTSRRAAHGGA